MDWLTVLGWTGSAILVLSLLQTRILRFRLINEAGTIALAIYNLLIAVWPMVALNCVLAVINAVFIVRLLRERHDEQAYEVIEARCDDPFLLRLLSVHHDDIARFQPDATWAPVSERDHALLILRGTEIVGLVLLDRDGTIARVRLDYVTPRFRDFTPGEFVWRHSGLLARLGFKHVMTPERVVSSEYYEDVGFRRNGRGYVLDL